MKKQSAPIVDDVTVLTEPPPRLLEYRCNGGAGRCHRLLFRGHLPPGAEIEIRCPNCHRTRTFYGPSNGKSDIIDLKGDYQP